MEARPEELLVDIQRKLGLLVVPISLVDKAGTLNAAVTSPDWNDKLYLTKVSEILAENDVSLFAYLVGELVSSSPDVLQKILSQQTMKSLVHPVFFGSALTGSGISDLVLGITKYFVPPNLRVSGDEVSGIVFAVEHVGKNDKLGYIRLFAGELKNRQIVRFKRLEQDGKISESRSKIAGLEIVGEKLTDSKNQVYATNANSNIYSTAKSLTAGNIGKILGIPSIRIGDFIGKMDRLNLQPNFAPPSLVTTIKPYQLGQDA